RPPALHAFHQPRLLRIMAVSRALRIDSGRMLVIVGAIEIGTPFPYVTVHIIQTEWIGSIGAHWCHAHIAIFATVLTGETPLVDVGRPLARGLHVVPPIIQAIASPGPGSI